MLISDASKDFRAEIGCNVVLFEVRQIKTPFLILMVINKLD